MLKTEVRALVRSINIAFFRPFRTLSSQPTAGETATGLGLVNVSQIAKAHGGAVSIQNHIGDAGCTVTLPLQSSTYKCVGTAIISAVFTPITFGSGAVDVQPNSGLILNVGH